MSGDAAQAIFDRAPIGLLVVDREGRVVGANLAASRTLKAPDRRVRGRLLRDFVPTGTSSRLPELARAIGAGRSWVGTISLKDAGGRTFEAELRASAAAGGLHVVAFEDVSDRSRADAALRRSGERYRRLSDHDRAVREEERSRLARELHDQLGQSLSAFKMDLAWLTAQTRRGEPETARAAIAGMMNRVDTAISIVRRIAGDLRPSVLDRLGLVAAIEWQAAEFERRTGVRCQIGRQGRCPPLDRAQSTEIFRIVQETLLNVSRHAGASCVKIPMTCSPARVAIRVSDNGRGIPQEAIDSDRSLGLIGMRERALILGGTLTLSRGARRGTEALLVVPRAPRLVGPETPARTIDR
jgi:signal transduction histidine kinase